MEDIHAIKLTMESFDNQGDTLQDIQFKIKEGCDFVQMVINEKIYNISRDNIIRLGKLSLPLKEKEVTHNGYTTTERYTV